MQSTRRLSIFYFLLGAVVILFALWLYNPFLYYFLNDDLVHIPLSKEGVLFQRRSFRPIGDLSVQLDFLLWGNKAFGYHLTNLVLHVANTLLVFLLSSELLRRYATNEHNTRLSFITCLLFFVYAFHSETIFWIIGRSGSLGTLFFIPALLFYLKRHGNPGLFILSLLMFELGLLAYESVWIFPFVACVIAVADIKWYQRDIKKETLYIALVVLVFIAHLFIRQRVIGELAGAYEAAAFIGIDLQRLGSNFFKLLGRLFIPPVQLNSLFVVCFLIGFAIAASIMVVAKRKRLFFKLYLRLWFLSFTMLIISVLPYLSLGIDTHSTEGERYLYMPTIFVCLLLVNVIHHIVSNNKQQLLVYALLLCFHLYFVANAAAHYKKASAISRITFEQINLLKGKQRLFIDSLPQSYKGALIFRLGFDEGAKWLKNDGSVDSIIVLSLKNNNRNWASDYQVHEEKVLPQGVIYKILVRDSSHQQTYIEQAVPGLVFNPQTDAWFIFKDTQLEVTR